MVYITAVNTMMQYCNDGSCDW